MEDGKWISSYHPSNSNPKKSQFASTSPPRILHPSLERKRNSLLKLRNTTIQLLSSPSSQFKPKTNLNFSQKKKKLPIETRKNLKNPKSDRNRHNRMKTQEFQRRTKQNYKHEIAIKRYRERASAHIPGLGVYADPILGFRRLGFGRQERERGGDIKRSGREHKSEGQKRHFGFFFFFFYGYWRFLKYFSRKMRAWKMEGFPRLPLCNSSAS